jgi:hypothetical protein
MYHALHPANQLMVMDATSKTALLRTSWLHKLSFSAHTRMQNISEKAILAFGL